MPTLKEADHPRVSEEIPAEELKTLNNFFNVYGRKTEFERQKKISRQWLNNILSTGRGGEKIIEAIREYYNSKQTKPAA